MEEVTLIINIPGLGQEQTQRLYDELKRRESVGDKTAFLVMNVDRFHIIDVENCVVYEYDGKSVKVTGV